MNMAEFVSSSPAAAHGGGGSGSPPTTEPFVPAPTLPSAGVFPSKQQQNDEAQAPLDDQERRAVQKRLQRKADEKKAEILHNGSMSVRENRSRGNDLSGAYTPKGSWLSGRLTGRRTARGSSSGGAGFLSSRSAAQSTTRSMMSTSRSMMTTARSDVATGRYNDAQNAEITETRILAISKLNGQLDEMTRAAEDQRRRTSARTGKTPRKSAASTAAGLRAGLLRRGVALRGKNTTGKTPRTARTGTGHGHRMPGERPNHGG